MITPVSPRETVTLTELADILDISLSTAYNLARTNELPIPTLRLGRQFRFSRRALDRYLDSDAPNGRAELEDAA